MLTLLISSPDKFNSEIEEVINLFEAGLPIFHVRKPKFSLRKMKAYISLIPSKFHERLVLHSHHDLVIKFELRGIHITESHRKNRLALWWRLKRYKMKCPELAITASFHGLRELSMEKRQYDYVFLSPIFKSISKNGNKPIFTLDQIKEGLKESKVRVIALGGVCLERMDAVSEMGFYGVAMLGGIWNHEVLNPVEAYQEIREYQHKLVRKVKFDTLRIAR